MIATTKNSVYRECLEEGAVLRMAVASKEGESISRRFRVYHDPLNGHILVYGDSLELEEERFIAVTGYRETNLLAKKVQIIPEEERAEAESKLRELISKYDRARNIHKEVQEIIFWD